MNFLERQICRSCNVELPKTNVLDLGEQTIVDFLLPNELGRGKAPLQLISCHGCGLLQLRHTVDPDTLYRQFWYRSSINEQMREALRNVVEAVLDRVELNDGDVVGDIGSNDGHLLTCYNENPEWVKRIGFEPCLQLAEESREKVDDGVILADYFSAGLAQAASEGKKYKVLTACAMFYDLDDPVKFLEDVFKVLDDDGLFVIQMNYLHKMLRNLTFDNIGHEHLCYYSLTALNSLLKRCGFSIVDVSLNDVNGGSIRVYIMKGTTTARITPQVLHILDAEALQPEEELLPDFCDRIQTACESLKSFLFKMKRLKKNVYAYGASTRGSTLLQTVFNGAPATELLGGVAERDPNKVGRRMAGLNLEIVAEDTARVMADYFLLLPYSFWPSISQREKHWMEAGGKFILPLPIPKVVSLKDFMGTKMLAAKELDAEEIVSL